MSDYAAQSQRVLEAIAQYTSKCVGAVHESIEAACLMVEADAKRNAPVGASSFLRNSITHVVQDMEPSQICGYVIAASAYAKHVEFGSGPHESNTGSAEFVASITLWCQRVLGIDNPFPVIQHIREHGTKPHPFLTPAFEANKNAIRSMIIKALEKVEP